MLCPIAAHIDILCRKSHECANKTRFSFDTTNMLLQLWLEYIMGVSQEWYQTVWIGSTQHTANCQAQMIKPEWNWPVCKGLLRARIIKVFHPPPLPHIDLRITRRFINTKCLTGNAVTLGIKLQLQKWNKNASTAGPSEETVQLACLSSPRLLLSVLVCFRWDYIYKATVHCTRASCL